MARVLITGAAGFIGMHTAIRFIKEGWDVVGIDNMNDYYTVQLKEDRLNEIEKTAQESNQHFSFHRNDLNSDIWDFLSNDKFDALIHLAAQAGVRYSLENPNAYLESNILGFQKVLDFVLKMKIKKFVYASSSSVYGKDSAQPFVESASCNAPESYYAATKKANELMANAYSETHKVSSIGLRFFTVYGPWGRPDMAPMLFTKAAMNGKIIRVFNNGEQKRDFTYIDDIVEGVYRLIVKYVPNEKAIIVNIGNGSPVGLLDFISKIEDQTGRILNKTFVEAQLGDVEVTYADTNKLVKLIDYRPKISLNDGLRKFVDWFKVYYKHDL